MAAPKVIHRFTSYLGGSLGKIVYSGTAVHKSLNAVRYVRADLVLSVLPENWREDAAWVRLAKALDLPK